MAGYICYNCGATWDGYKPLCPDCGSIDTHAQSNDPSPEPEDDEDDPQPGDVSDVWTD